MLVYLKCVLSYIQLLCHLNLKTKIDTHLKSVGIKGYIQILGF